MRERLGLILLRCLGWLCRHKSTTLASALYAAARDYDTRPCGVPDHHPCCWWNEVVP